MTPPRCLCNIAKLPRVREFLPASGKIDGVVDIAFDELEAMRLADVEGLSQREGARRLGVSAATLNRLARAARKAAAEALSRGLPIRLVKCRETSAG